MGRKVWPGKNEKAREIGCRLLLLGPCSVSQASPGSLGHQFPAWIPSFNPSGTRAIESQRLVVTLCDSGFRERSCHEAERGFCVRQDCELTESQLLPRCLPLHSQLSVPSLYSERNTMRYQASFC